MRKLLGKFLWLIINICQTSFTALWTAFWVPIGLVLILTVGRRLPLKWAGTVWAPGLLWGARVRLDVRGLENVDFSKPHVFVCNHQSTVDIPAVFAALPTNLHFIVKKELAYAPFVGLFVWASGMIFVDRKEGLRALRGLQRVGGLIRAGQSVIAFAEGTRSRTGEVLPFKKGVFVAAIESGVPVVPIGIQGAGKIMPASSWAIRPGTIRVTVGKPIPTTGLALSDLDQLSAKTRAAVIELVVQ